MITVPELPERGGSVLDWAKAITKALRAMLPTESKDVLPQSTQNGTSYILRRQAPQPTRQGHCFEVYPSSIEDDGTVTTAIYCTVFDMSWLMRSMKWDDNQDIDGMADEFLVNPNDKIWLHLDINDDREITGATIEHGVPSDNDWDKFPEPVKFDDDDDTSPDRKQTGWNQLLAYLTDFPDDGEPAREGKTMPFESGTQLLVQCTRTALRACEMCDERNGLIVKALVPWFEPYLGGPDDDDDP